MWTITTTYEYVKRCTKDMSFKISKEELEHLYCKDELSTYKIAEMYGVSNSTVGTKMRSYGIPRRNLSECKTGDKNPNYNNGEKLKGAWARGCYSRRNITGSKNPNYKNRLEQMECDFCGAPLSKYPSQRHGEHVFCNRSCASKYRMKHSKKIQNGVEGYKHSQETKEKIRESRKNLSLETLEKMSEARRGKKHSEETLKKMSESHYGEKNSNWKNGASFEPYCPKFNEAFKESIREMFGRVCFLCPTTEEENSRKLSVHHVNYNKDCLCDDCDCEFVPLCMRCHAKTNSNHDYWENLIMEKLNGKYILF